MLRYLGFSGLVGFGAALFSIGKKGKERVRLFERYFNQGNVDALCSLFERSDCHGAMAARELLAQGGQMVVGKTIAAGTFVSSSVLVHRGSDILPGVAFFDFDRRSGSLIGFRFFARKITQ